jgi:hypothetical protein
LKLRIALLESYPDLAPLSKSTLWGILRHNLGMRYRRVNLRHGPVETQIFKEIKGEICKAILAFNNLRLPRIYIDEYIV